jgi:hypothetical protein
MKRDYTIYDSTEEDSDIFLDDERTNLDVKLSTKIIAIADLGLWNGRRLGYKILSNNLNSIFNCYDSCENIKLFADRYNVQGIGYHHDGTNYITYRRLKDDLTENQTEILIDAIYKNSVNADKFIKKYTVSIRKDVANIYGW